MHLDSFVFGVLFGVLALIAGIIFQIEEIETYSNFIMSNVAIFVAAYVAFIGYIFLSGLKIKEIESSADALLFSRVKGFILGIPMGSFAVLYALQAGL